jgi:hypothetical protein
VATGLHKLSSDECHHMSFMKDNYECSFVPNIRHKIPIELNTCSNHIPFRTNTIIKYIKSQDTLFGYACKPPEKCIFLPPVICYNLLRLDFPYCGGSAARFETSKGHARTNNWKRFSLG